MDGTHVDSTTEISIKMIARYILDLFKDQAMNIEFFESSPVYTRESSPYFTICFFPKAHEKQSSFFFIY